MQTLESLAVITAESQQHQVATDIIDAIDSVLPRLAPDYCKRSMDLLLRTLPALSSHPPTLRLETAVRKLHNRIGAVDAEYTPR
jgi:hypothetical protein